MLGLLNKACELYVNGTFKVVGKPFVQLWPIHCPGEDGLTGEVYKSSKDVIVKLLTEVINNIWIQGKQPPSHKMP